MGLKGTRMHKVIIVGRGLFGSAATRHLAERSDGILCVGPNEPKNRQTHTGVFGSHYDEGRMTRVVDPVSEWVVAAKNSIDRYADLEKRSGIKFFTSSGYLGIGDFRQILSTFSNDRNMRGDQFDLAEADHRRHHYTF
jgi:sarcosine oxidase